MSPRPGTDRTPSSPPARRSSSGTGLEAGLGFRLSRATRALRAHWERQLAELRLSPPQAAVLRAVAGRDGLSLRALARTLGSEPMKVKRCVDELEERGLIGSAHRGADRRPRALALTENGRQTAERVDALVHLQEQDLDRALGHEGRAQLEHALDLLELRFDLSPAAGAARRQEAPAALAPGRPGAADSKPTQPGRRGALAPPPVEPVTKTGTKE